MSEFEDRRRIALEAASRAVCAGLPARTVQDPDSVARRTISVAVIFESYLKHGAMADPFPSEGDRQ